MNKKLFLLTWVLQLFALPLHAQYAGGNGIGDTAIVTNPIYLDGVSGLSTDVRFATEPAYGIQVSTNFTVTAEIVTVKGDRALSNSNTITLALVANPGGATLSGTTSVAAVNGLATFSNMTLDQLGIGYTLSATATGLNADTSVSFRVYRNSISFSTEPTAQVVANTPFTVAVAVLDTNGNVLTSATNSISVALLSNPGGATLSGTTTVSAVSGVATFSTLSLDQVASGYTLTATATALTGDTSTSFLTYLMYQGGNGMGDTVYNNFGTTFYNQWKTDGTTDFTAATNWSSGSFPLNELAVIPSGGTQPIITSSATVSSGTSLTLNSGSSLTINSGGTLTVNNAGTVNNYGTLTVNNTGTITLDNGSTYTNQGSMVFNNSGKLKLNGGTFTNSGTLNTRNATVSYGASTAQTINTGFLSSDTLDGLEINNAAGVTIANGLTINTPNLNILTGKLTTGTATLRINAGGTSSINAGGKLEVSGGGMLAVDGSLTNNDTITFRSVNNSTAMLGASTGSITNSGNGKVSIERYIPANGTRRYRMLASNLASYTFSQLIDDIYVTGPSSGVGFDASPIHSNNPSVYTYQETNGGTGRGWKAVDNINNSLPTGLGAYVFVRGDRTLSAPSWYQAPYATPNNVTTDHIGDVVIGNVSPAITYTNTGTAANDGYNFVGNPYPAPIDWSLITKNNLSAFYYVYNPGTGSTEANVGSSVIASGQGFWVQATSASPSITFTESCKSTESPTDNTYFKSATAPLTIQMIKDSVNSDMVKLRFNNNASLNFNHNEDARKMTNSTLNIALFADSQKVQINTVPPSASVADTFDLLVAAAQGNYQLQFKHANQIPAGKTLLLRDLFVQSVIPITNNMTLPLQITAANASQGKRYQLILINTNALPVEWLGFNGEVDNGDALLKWTTISETNCNHFVLQRKKGGESTFTHIAQILAKGNTSQHTSYMYADKDVFTSGTELAYYRLIEVDKDGREHPGQSIVLHHAKLSAGNPTTVWPNPANVSTRITSNQPIHHIQITDITGKVVFDKTVDQVLEYDADLSNFKHGIYFIRVNRQHTSKLVIK